MIGSSICADERPQIEFARQPKFLTFLSNILKSSPYPGESSLFCEMPLPPNTRLGRYEIRSLLGIGGMGEVYLGYDTSLRRQVTSSLLSTSKAKAYTSTFRVRPWN